jgi:integrase
MQYIPKRRENVLLTEQAIRERKIGEKITRLSDGGGLYLEIHLNGSRYWKLYYRNKLKKPSTTAIGKWPAMSLKEARAAAAAFKAGIMTEKEEPPGRKFGAIAQDWLAGTQLKNSLKERVQKKYYLDKIILPALGELNPDDITAKLILNEVLRPIEAEGRGETARRVKQVIGQIFKYAVILDEAKSDPTSVLKGVLQPLTVKHRAALTAPAEVGKLLDDIAAYSGSVSVEYALKILPYVFVRPGELRRAEWAEFDFSAKLWRIPAEKMKMRSPHLVPLSDQVMKLLEELKEYTGEGRYLFPGRAADKPISDMALTAALRYLGYSTEQVCPHGFRGMASTMLNERGYNSDWIERQLAHSERSGVRAAYNHADYLKERTRMMGEWADLLDSLRLNYRESRRL